MFDLWEYRRREKACNPKTKTVLIVDEFY